MRIGRGSTAFLRMRLQQNRARLYRYTLHKWCSNLLRASSPALTTTAVTGWPAMSARSSADSGRSMAPGAASLAGAGRSNGRVGWTVGDVDVGGRPMDGCTGAAGVTAPAGVMLDETGVKNRLPGREEAVEAQQSLAAEWDGSFPPRATWPAFLQRNVCSSAWQIARLGVCQCLGQCSGSCLSHRDFFELVGTVSFRSSTFGLTRSRGLGERLGNLLVDLEIQHFPVQRPRSSLLKSAAVSAGRRLSHLRMA